MLVLGVDLGTSSVKVSVIDAASQKKLASASWPETEAEIVSVQRGWAEQSPEIWWEHVQQAIRKCHEEGNYHPTDISAIGIAYQMHGLVLVNSALNSIRKAIIWCDSRAVETGEEGLSELGAEYCQQYLLNSPGNFTASKLAWVRKNEPFVFQRIQHFMLPGDFIAMKLTGELTTTASALSEGIFWDFRNARVSDEVLQWAGWSSERLPKITPVFADHGHLQSSVAQALSLRPGIPVSYKAGDQPNNALALQVMEPGEVAVNAGTSGVIYAITDQLQADYQSRVNSFAHVNYNEFQQRIGVLLCINGAGIFNRWARQLLGNNFTYQQINQLVEAAPAGSQGLMAFPFGNGAERMLNNLTPGAGFVGIDLNLHGTSHWLRAVQEGIAFAFRYGMDIMLENGLDIHLLRAGNANLFQSSIFTQTLADICGYPIELRETDGSVGAAIGAALGLGYYQHASDAAALNPVLQKVEPLYLDEVAENYMRWKTVLQQSLHKLEPASSLTLSES